MKFLAIHILFVAALAIQPVSAQQKTVEERVEYAQTLLREGIQQKDSAKIAEGYYLLAKTEATALRLEAAYTLYYQALTYHIPLKNHYKAGKIYIRLADLELRQQDPEKAKYYIHEAIQICSTHSLPKGLLSAYRLLGEIYLKEPDNPDGATSSTTASLDSALHYLQKAETLSIEIEDEKELATVRYNIGRLYAKRLDKRAIKKLEYAVEITSKNKPLTPIINSRTALAHAWLNFENPDEAKKIIAASEQLIGNNGNVELLTRAEHHTVYSKYYKTIGEWELALDHGEIATDIYNRIAKTERNINLSRWRVRFETEKKELELKMRKQELESREKVIAQQKYLILLAILSILLLALLCYFFYKNYKRQQSLSRKNAFLIQEQNHRVKNNLQVISSMLSLQQDQVLDPSAIKVLSENQTRIDSMMLLHRQLYENDEVELIDIEEFFYDIIASVALTFGKGDFEASLNMKVKYLDADLATSIGVVLNELIVNSFKHSFIDRTPQIEISSIQRQGNVEITYKDFGPVDIGEKFEECAKKGFGLQLVDMILFQVNGTLKYSYRNGSVFKITFKHKAI